MNQLPPGFVLDDDPSGAGGAGLPPGFVLDDAPDITSPGGLDFSAQQFADLPQASEVDQQRMGDLASAYRVAGPDRGMAVDARVEHLQRTTNPYLNATWQGMTSGFGDEVGAAARTGLGQGESYDENLAVERELLRRQRQDAPWTMAGAEIVGAALPAMLTGGVSVAARYLPQAPRIARTVDAALTGGLYGGLYGAGTGEGVEGRMEEAAKGAGYGALAGGVAQPVIEGAVAGGRAVANAVGDYVAPFTQGGRERLAATTMREAATDPVALQQALDNPEQIVPSVPGSRPTTFQQAGDMGIGALERRAETLDPVPFQQRRADQNAARVDYLHSLQREGSPEAVVNTLRQNLADIDRMTAEALDTATATARQRTAALGGAGTPEGYGATLRGQLDQARRAAKARESALWDAVDPDGTLAAEASAIRSTWKDILRELPKAAKPMEGEERAIFETAARFNGVMPFKEIAALRTRLNDAMRDELSEHGSSEVYRRLTQLRGAVEDVLDGTVAQRAAQEAQAVAAGALDPDATMMANFKRVADEWASQRAAREIGLEAGQGARPTVGYTGGGQAGFSGVRGATSEAGRGFREPSGNSGLPGNDGLQPNFTPEAYGRLREASAATKARAQTFDEGIVGDVLARSGSQGPFHVPAAAVPEKLFRRGAMGAEGMRALQQAANSPETMATIRDYAISNLRRFAENADGTLHPAKVTVWRKAHADALRAMPEIDRMLAGPVEAAEAVAQLAVNRKAALDAARVGAIGRLIDAAPEDVTRKLGAVFSTENPARTMRMLMSETGKNPEAREGLRKGIADWIVQRFLSNTEAGTSGQTLMRSDQFQQFVRQNAPALGIVFKPGEVQALKAIAADLQQANRSVAAVKLPGRSNTAQDIIAEARRSGGPQSWLSRIAQGVASISAGTLATGGPWGGAAAFFGTELLGSLRRAGLQKVDDILADALLNPGRAAVLLRKAPANPTPKEIQAFGNAYRRAAFASVIAETDGDEPRRK